MFSFGLIVCTYKRPVAVKKLMHSVQDQSWYPNEILIVDASPDDETRRILNSGNYRDVRYIKADKNNRGLTRQRNLGLSQLSDALEVICFLDDDVILEPEYFEMLLSTYRSYPDAVGVGGYIVDDEVWRRATDRFDSTEFSYDGWVRRIGSRNMLRKKLGLLSNMPPGFMPESSNGLSIGFLPPSGKTYPVEFFMGGVASYRKEIFNTIRFSCYFEGYGLYEDMDFCLRASRIGQLYVNTSARLRHYHDHSGRPNRYEYGKMVIRNGWYVWRVKYPSPKLEARLKWHATTMVLTLVRLGNTISTSERKEALTESLGRMVGWWSLIFNKPKHEA